MAETSSPKDSERSERREVISFLSFLHHVLVKVIRDGEKCLTVFIPRYGQTSHLAITVQVVPRGYKPVDTAFVLDEVDVNRAVSSLTFNPSAKQIDEIFENCGGAFGEGKL
jgi:hypothetical protein